MGLLDSLKRAVASQPAQPTASPDTQAKTAQLASQPHRSPDPEEIKVPEVSAQNLISQVTHGAAPQFLDCREPFEWSQVRIPGSLHIPMNQIPGRLAELDKGQEWVVVCAHGNRSYSVAGYLIQQGYHASSLAGGVNDWWIRGGPIESDYRQTAAR